MIFTIISILSLIGLLSYYIIFSRIKISSFDIDNSSFNKPISVVICAKNELENLQKHSSSWLIQSYCNYELIIVNDESTDGSYEFLTLLAAENENVKIIHVERAKEQNKELIKLKGKRYALRKGILAAKHDYLLFTDADCFANSNLWITEMTKAFSSDKIKIVLGFSPYVKKKNLLNKFIQLETLLTAFHYFGFANMGFPYMGVGRNIAYKKCVFTDEVFLTSNQSISGDDDLIVQQFASKNNTAYVTSLNSRMISIPARNLKSYIKQKKRHLSAGLYYSTKMKFFLNLFPLLMILFFVSCFFMSFYNFLFSFFLLLVNFFVFIILIFKSNLFKT